MENQDRIIELEQKLNSLENKVTELTLENEKLKAKLEYLQGVQDEQAIREINQNYQF